MQDLQIHKKMLVRETFGKWKNKDLSAYIWQWHFNDLMPNDITSAKFWFACAYCKVRSGDYHRKVFL